MLLLFRMFDERIFCIALRGDPGISKGTFALAGVYAASFAALCTTAWCDVAGACPLKCLSPLKARSSRHVFIETLQSKDFRASLLICGNFQITAFRVHSSQKTKIILKTVPHPKQSGHNLFSGVESLSIL